MLKESLQTPIRGADRQSADRLFDLAIGEDGMEEVTLFGVERLMDFSQYAPRGHYDTWSLHAYFKAMMWLGRIDSRLVETDEFGNRNLNREQVEATLAMDLLMTDEERALWSRTNDTVEIFVGKSDNMTVIEIASLKEALGIDSRSEFAALASAMALLGEMAAQQRDGIPFTGEQLKFVNDAVYIGEEDVECAIVPYPRGWYTRILFRPDELTPWLREPTIADVHTQPADEAGNIVGRILHVGVGDPRMMMVAVDTCDGPYAYVGPVFAYHEKVTENFERMTDNDWSAALDRDSQPDVPWMLPVIAE